MSLSIKNDLIYSESNGKIHWQLDCKKIVVIGEYTTSDGPFLDDYFIVFAEEIEQLRHVSFYEIDHLTFWKEISQQLNIEIAPSLTSSTQWASNLIYPKNLEGNDLFTLIKEEVKPKTFLQKVFGKTLHDERRELTEGVKKLFK